MDKKEKCGRIYALAGNPNVGKSTVFNELTGLRQHTGNWTGKTVANAWGKCKKYDAATLVDLPGCYSLFASSEEEAIAGEFIAYGNADATIVVVDATNLERNLILLIQTLEISPRVVLAVNLLDEAKRCNMSVDVKKLSETLGIETVGIVAKRGKGLEELMNAASRAVYNKKALGVTYGEKTEKAISVMLEVIENEGICVASKRFLALKLLQSEKPDLGNIVGGDNENILSGLERAHNIISLEEIRDDVTSAVASKAVEISSKCVEKAKSRRITTADRIIMGKYTAFPVMLLMLAGIFRLTVKWANYPSELLSRLLFGFEDTLFDLCDRLCMPEWLSGAIVLGMYRTLAWIVSVMLPPMAIFFPLFTLLEDAGFLPRLAFDLDRAFCRCSACGKQSLTMCMGLGCNAVGVTGCRIIDSPRERLVAILTNSFIPCNGRFPMILAITSAFAAAGSGVAEPVVLCLVIMIGIAVTLGASALLSKTLLKGQPSAFVLEIPPFRRPQIVKTLVRSVFDRTLHVLGRAVTIAAPAGLIIYILANTGMLAGICSALDGFGRLIGMDGVILTAFILGLPANEIVLPIILMGYSSGGFLVRAVEGEALNAILTANGWSCATAICVVLFSVMHSPCSTTLITVWKETKSPKWVLVSFLLPTAFGVLSCLVINAILYLVL